MKHSPILLGKLADIRTGYVFRGKIREDAAGNVSVIQNKDLTPGRVELSTLTPVSIPDRGNLWRVHKGDILLRSRGADAAVAVVAEEPPSPAIAASPLLHIRLREGAPATPPYIAWLLAQPAAQDFLRSNAIGSTIRTISKGVAERLPLELPPLEQQNLIAQIAALSTEIQHLAHLLADKEAAYINTLLNR